LHSRINKKDISCKLPERLNRFPTKLTNENNARHQRPTTVIIIGTQEAENRRISVGTKTVGG
jgi:hypothetical protein